MKIKEWHSSKVAISLKAVAFNNNGKILVLQRLKEDYSRPMGWDLVGGGLDKYEDPTEGIKREIKEETDLEVTDVRPIDITSFKEEDGCFTVMIGFSAMAITSNVKLSSEHIAFKWLTPEEILNLDIPDIYKKFIRSATT